MKAFVNKQEIEVFRGATVADLVLAFSESDWKLLKEGRISVYDHYGNLTEADGPIIEGQHFFLNHNNDDGNHYCPIKLT